MAAGPGGSGRQFAYNASLSPRARYLDGISFLAVRDRDAEYFNPAFLAAARTLPSPLDQYRAYLGGAPTGDALSRLLYLDTKTYLPADILTKVDRMSMAVSLEARVPILDHVFVEWVTGLPIDWKLRGGTGKYIFRKLAERLGIPKEVLYRPKQGFALPLKHWIRKELKQEITRVLLEPRSLQRGYSRRAALERRLQEHYQGRRDHSGLLWQLLVFELWHQNYLEGAATVRAETPAAALGTR